VLCALCSGPYNFSAQLYSKYKNVIVRYLCDVAAVALRAISANDNSRQFLREVRCPAVCWYLFHIRRVVGDALEEIHNGGARSQGSFSAFGSSVLFAALFSHSLFRIDSAFKRQ
jgi:hypothetical protein